MVEDIANLGVVPSGYSYSLLPMFQIALAVMMEIFSINYLYASMILSSIVGVTILLLVYSIALKVTNDPRVAFTSMIIAMMGNYVIFSLSWFIPNSLACCLSLAALYIFINYIENRKVSYLLLLAAICSTLILTHTLISAITFLMLLSYGLIFAFINGYFGRKKHEYWHYASMPILLIIAMLTWWGYASGYIGYLADMITWGFSRDFFVSGSRAVALYSASIPGLEYQLSILPLISFVALGILGLLMLLRKYEVVPSIRAVSYCLVILVPLAISFFTTILGISFLEERWWILVQIFFSIPVAFFIVTVLGKPKLNISKPILVIALTFIMLLSATSPVASVDAGFFTEDITVRYATVDSEMIAAEFIIGHVNSGLVTDDYFSNVMKKTGGQLVSTYDGGIVNRSFTEYGSKTIVIRKEILTNPFLLDWVGAYRLEYDPMAMVMSEGMNTIYSDSSVYALN